MMPSVIRFLIGSAFVFASNQVPAPIVEEATPKPSETHRPIPRSSIETSSSHHPSVTGSLSKFEGTWLGTAPYDGGGTTTGHYSYTIVIKEGRVSSTLTLTKSLLPGQRWPDAAQGYETVSPISFKWSCSANQIKADGPNLTIHWSGGQLTCSPKAAIRPETFEQIQTSPLREPKVSTYTLRGNQLTRESDPNGGVIYTRAK